MAHTHRFQTPKISTRRSRSRSLCGRYAILSMSLSEVWLIHQQQSSPDGKMCWRILRRSPSGRHDHPRIHPCCCHRNTQFSPFQTNVMTTHWSFTRYIRGNRSDRAPRQRYWRQLETQFYLQTSPTHCRKTPFKRSFLRLFEWAAPKAASSTPATSWTHYRAWSRKTWEKMAICDREVVASKRRAEHLRSMTCCSNRLKASLGCFLYGRTRKTLRSKHSERLEHF
eukprot:COSAG03_NODE_353_length_8690_cov_4.738680_2_plen_225_part_00